MRIAAIDIGTVTSRLLIADVTHSTHTELYRDLQITNLGEGMERGSGALSAAAIDRVIQAVSRFIDAVESYQVDQMVAVATSAARDALNGDELCSAVGELGVELVVLPGSEEARLSFAGATADVVGSVLVADVGGGSTEIIVGEAGAFANNDAAKSRHNDRSTVSSEIHSAHSFDIGSRRITNKCLPSDPPSTVEIDKASREVRTLLAPYFDRIRSTYQKVIAVAGTATSLSAINQKLDPYDPIKVHNSTLTLQQLAQLQKQMGDMPLRERTHVIGLEPERAPVIVGGTIILQELLELSGQKSLTVSENDLLLGLILDTYAYNR